MAIVVSTFYTPRASIDGCRSTDSTPRVLMKQTINSRILQLGAYAGQVCDGLNHRRRQIKSLLISDGIENIACVSEPASDKLSVQAPPDTDACTSHFPDLNTDGQDPRPRSPFRKWMVSMQKRSKNTCQSPMLHSRNLPSFSRLADDRYSTLSSYYPIRAKSSCGSSFRFVSAVCSASISLAGFSSMTRTNTAVSRCASLADRDANQSKAEPRTSGEMCVDRSIPLDSAALDRALQRRRILEELIDTEENYIGDIRLLLNVYVTMLVSLPSTYPGLRKSVNQNLSDILQLHEEILEELHRAVAHSEYKDFGTLRSSSGTAVRLTLGQVEVYHRLEAGPDGAVTAMQNRRRLPTEVVDLCAEPQVIAEISKIFDRKMTRFFIYKEYGAKYEMMAQETASVYDTLPGWDWNQKGLEALSALLYSKGSAGLTTNRASTMKDLLVKPIQRICRYPLIFAELLKYTPVSDCPNAHMAAGSVLGRFREATAEINQVTNDPQARTTLSRSWLLQDRLVFPNRSFDSVSKDRVKSFGHVRLCGALHVCWQSQNEVDGQYLISLLYPDVLCLACAGKADPIYTIKACINVHEIKIEEAGNGRGLQCHTAPFSWKLVFEFHHQLFEIVMTACNAKEEMEWRARLSSPRTQCKTETATSFSFLDLDIKSIGMVATKSDPGTRRLSIRRATTVCPKPALYQVILKNTSGIRQSSGHAATTLSIRRSHSLLATKARVSFLAPARSERTRLETILADVWSREILPFPGMGVRSRSERLVRSSASTVIRKLSVASISSSLAKRAGGLRQRMPLEDSFQSPVPDTTLSSTEMNGLVGSCKDHDSDKQKSAACVANYSWPQQEMDVKVNKRRGGVSSHGLRRIFS